MQSKKEDFERAVKDFRRGVRGEKLTTRQYLDVDEWLSLIAMWLMWIVGARLGWIAVVEQGEARMVIGLLSCGSIALGVGIMFSRKRTQAERREVARYISEDE